MGPCRVRPRRGWVADSPRRNAVVAIGDGHDPKLVAELKKAKAYSGTIDMKKGSLTSPGELTVSGCKANRYEFETYLKTFTKKKVKYV